MDPFTNQKFFGNIWDVIGMALGAAIETIEKAKPRPNCNLADLKSGTFPMIVEKGAEVFSHQKTSEINNCLYPGEHCHYHTEWPSDLLNRKCDYKWTTQP